MIQAVIPLSEECGLLEWVSNTTGLRQITDNLFKYVSTYYSSKAISDITVNSFFETNVIQIQSNLPVSNLLSFYNLNAIYKNSGYSS